MTSATRGGLTLTTSWHVIEGTGVGHQADNALLEAIHAPEPLEMLDRNPWAAVLKWTVIVAAGGALVLLAVLKVAERL